MSNIICISLQGLGIPDYIRDHLLLTSSDMYKKRLDFSKFEWGNYEGRIATSFRQVGFGIFSGVWFFAEIEWELDGHSQKTIMNYIVHPRDLSTAWADFLLEAIVSHELDEMSEEIPQDTIGPTAWSC